MRNKLITIISLPVLCIASVWAQEKTTGSDMLQFDETTISASTVSGKELMKRSNINPANALYGKLNGLFIRQNGEYGDGEGYPSMNIRGIGSLNNNSILVFVDGLERDINSLVLEEIEEITILKDAADVLFQSVFINFLRGFKQQEVFNFLFFDNIFFVRQKMIFFRIILDFVYL